MEMLRIEHLSKFYWVDGKAIPVLSDIHLTFPSNGLIFLLGPSGSGKSTLLHIIAGISHANEGSIFDQGVLRVAPKVQKQFHDHTSILFQSFLLLEEHSPLKNVMFPLLIQGMSFRKAKKVALKLLDDFNLKYLHKRDSKSLSGGEKQRVALLRMIAHNQAIFLADEPTGALDEENGTFIIEQLQAMSRSKLVIVVTHNLSLAEKYGDRIIYLSDGRICRDEKKNREVLIGNHCGCKKKFPNKFLSIALAIHDLRKHFNRHVLGLAASFISMTCLMIGIHFYQATETFVSTFVPLVTDYAFVQINKKTAFQVEGSPLVLTKSERPSVAEMEAMMVHFPRCTYQVDLHPILNQNVRLLSQGQMYDDFYLSFYEDTQKDGSTLYVNSLLWKQLESAMPNVAATLSWTFTIASKNSDFSEEISFSLPFFMLQAEAETEFMNEPCLYVPYQFIVRNLSQVTITNDNQSLLDYVSQLPSNHYLTGYAYTIWLNSSDFYRKIKALNQADYQDVTYAFTNTQLIIFEAYQSMFSGLNMVVLIFLTIALFGTIALVGILTYANIQLHRKEMAISTIIGMPKQTIWSIFLCENGGVQLVACVGACILYAVIHPIIQMLVLQGLALPKSFFQNGFGWIDGMMIVGTVLFSFILTTIILFGVGQIELERELKEL